jgi:hypothetical protein
MVGLQEQVYCASRVVSGMLLWSGQGLIQRAKLGGRHFWEGRMVLGKRFAWNLGWCHLHRLLSVGKLRCCRRMHDHFLLALRLGIQVHSVEAKWRVGRGNEKLSPHILDHRFLLDSLHHRWETMRLGEGRCLGCHIRWIRGYNLHSLGLLGRGRTSLQDLGKGRS